MKPLLFAVLFAVMGLSSPAVVIPCPKFCKCEYDNNILTAKCSSQKFLHKLDEKQASAIQSLDLSNCSIQTLDKKLKKLSNLQNLDLSNNELRDMQQFPKIPKLEKLSLSNNQIKNLSFSILPKTIKDLDISSNFISDLPKDWNLLHHLNILHIQNNPVYCDDNAISKYVNLINLKVNITENVICQHPKNVKGKNLQSLIADSLLDPMLGDQEGTTENEDEDIAEFIKHSTEKPESEFDKVKDDLFEGSGDDEGSGSGSGDSDKEMPSACVIDCTTFKPLEILKENNTSPLLSIREQVGILFGDLFGNEQEEPTSSITPILKEKTWELSDKPVTIPMSATKTTKKTEKLVVSESDKKTDSLERASLGTKEDGYTYYLIATVIVLMVIVAIFIIIKKKSSQGAPKRKRNSMTEMGIYEEMKPLGKYKDSSNGTNNDKQKDDDPYPERIPLMNGQNGKTESHKASFEDLDVTLRTPSENGSSPKPERVTITASEIPHSILKTPQLVRREKNSDGEIITKPLDDSY